MASKISDSAIALKLRSFELKNSNNGRLFTVKLYLSNASFWHANEKSNLAKNRVISCSSYRSQTETNKCVKSSKDSSFSKRGYGIKSKQGLSEACRFVYNDAKFVNERAQNDILLISRGIRRLNDRAIQDVAVLGNGLFKLDARARKETKKIDHDVKEKAAHINHIATILKEKAHSDLKRAADKHWSDGALEADLRRADFIAKRRAMEDAFMALKFVRNIHEMMAGKLYEEPTKEGSFLVDDSLGFITLQKNGKSLDLLSRQVSTDRITAIEEAYWSMASALSEADGIDYTNPEELELLVATLIDLDAMDGKSSVSLLAECSSSPDVNTRKALANALAIAPSMWILGNAGMGALQRLAQDSNPAVANAASKAINELKKQWELEEGDSLTFKMNQNFKYEIDFDSDSDD
ncbi:hypothetical protein LUZ60_012706 [Juncus effusus]|nr:hypothetical protein LUZ60_012706 [Juncus effusus]